MAREEHVQAVGFAGLKVEELEQALVALTEEVDLVHGIAVNAVGEKPSTISGRNALESIHLIRVALVDATEACEAAKTHFNSYGKGL